MRVIGPPVEYLNQRKPWDVPGYMPPSPHNLPVREVPQSTKRLSIRFACDGFDHGRHDVGEIS
jgi:hypothetical protein